MTIPDSYWSAEPPNKPGWYLWKQERDSSVVPVSLNHSDTNNMGGLWCRLVPEAGTVPKDELGKAWNEGFKNGSDAGIGLLTAQPFKDGVEAWLDSRARKVMEGTL